MRENSLCHAATRRQGILFLVCAGLLLILLLFLSESILKGADFHRALARFAALPGSMQLVLLFFLGFFLFCLVLGLHYLLRPTHSKLARSIRAHLPPERQDLSGEELFALVDEDLLSPEQRRFGRLIIGERWVLCGCTALPVEQIADVASRCFWNTSQQGSHTYSYPTYQLTIRDTLGKKHRIQLRDGYELAQAEEYLDELAHGAWWKEPG